MWQNWFISVLVSLCLIQIIGGFQLFGGNGATAIDTSEYYDRRPMTAYSFKAPFYLVRGAIPFWKFEGDTVVTDEFVRLTPAEKSRKGAIWNTKLLVFDAWEVEIRYKIGSTTTVGADGMAFWFVADQYSEGPVYGAADHWKGLAVMFDTFDNDGAGDNPRLGAFYNDGSWAYGEREPNGQNELGGCRCMYRNVETYVKIQYFDGNLQILYKLNPNAEWAVCTQVKITLPTGYYFGMSAETGGLVDNHDVYSFEAFRLISKTGVQTPQINYQAISQQQQNQQHQAQQQAQQQQQNQQQRPDPTKDNRFQSVRDKLNGINSQDVIEPAKFEEPIVPPPVQQQQQQPVAEPIAPPPPVQQQQQQQQAPQNPPYQQQPPVQQQQPPAPYPPVYNNQYQPPQAQQQYQPPPVYNNQYQPPQGQQQYAGNQMTSQELEDMKTDIDKVVEQLNSISNDVRGIAESVRRLTVSVDTFSSLASSKADVNAISQRIEEYGKLANRPGGDNKGTDELSRQLSNIDRTITEMRKNVDDTKRQQQNLEVNFKKSAEDITSSVESSSSWGFWTYFILFQLCFGVAYMWWRKARDDSNKKLF